MSDRWRELYAEECARKERLEGELAAERKMREEVEEELYQERLQHTAAVTRAEQACEVIRNVASALGCAVSEVHPSAAAASDLADLTEQAERALADVQQDIDANAHEMESLLSSLRQAERERDEERAQHSTTTDALLRAVSERNEARRALETAQAMAEKWPLEVSARERVESERDEAIRLGAVGTYERDELNREIQRLTQREQAAIDSIARSGVAAEHGLLHAVDGLLAARERAEADNAALFEAFRAAHDPHVLGCSGAPCACGAIRVMDAQHPGAALLEERRRIQKTLDETNVPSEADEYENGRACDFAGRVELLATWGRRGWDEYRRLKDAEAALLEYVRALEKVRERLRDDVSGGHIVLVDDCRELSEACRAADALKERKS